MTDSKIEIRTDASKILMSDTLKGNLADFEELDEQQEEPRFVVVILERIIDGTATIPLVGSLVSVLFDEHNELEMKVELGDGFKSMVFAAKANVIVNGFKMAMGEDHVEIKGPFAIEAIRMQDIDHSAQMCVLAMKLSRVRTP